MDGEETRPPSDIIVMSKLDIALVSKIVKRSPFSEQLRQIWAEWKKELLRQFDSIM
jgi:hypothetical protein